MIEKSSVKGAERDLAILPVLPLKNVVLLPKSIIPVIVGRDASIKAVEHALKHDKTIFVSTQKKIEVETPTLGDLFEYGTRSTVLQIVRMPKGSLKILVEGICRSKIIGKKEAESGEFLLAQVEDLETEKAKCSIKIQAIWRHLQTLYSIYAQLNPKVPADLLSMAKNVCEMDYIGDTIAMHINLSFESKQKFLETTDLEERLLSLCNFLKKEVEILEMEEKIRTRVQGQLEKSQREYYLNEQMKAIQKELGRGDKINELGEIRKKIGQINLSEEAKEKLNRELYRLEQMPPMSSEAVVNRNYIDWVISLPWNKFGKDNVGLKKAEEILHKNHAGLKEIKERILEFLAAKKFSKNLKRAPIICLVGPPGVGKTSLAKSISESMGREYVRISLGGIRDEAEIRGHRRTYIGALPGKIIQSLRKVKTSNCLILLDEIDKISSDIHGDPASALLEVLDPEQNKSFVDNFIEIEYDLSKIMFIATANHTDGIPYPLYDRMEVLNLSGYTEKEKIEVAEKFLIPKSLEEYDLSKSQFKLSRPLLRKIINLYTKEAGVRQLERLIAKLMRKTIQKILKDEKVELIKITETLLKEWLGPEKYKKSSLSKGKKIEKIGLATGLAWTEFGGDILEVEASVTPGKGALTLTGQLGDVMQESAQAALTYVRSRAQDFKLSKSFSSNKDIHVHVPEGATPKDGPSAGITMCAALVSALTKVPLKNSVAMTGEITLRGRVLPVGGLKEKILAAKQNGLKNVILPAENKRDVENFKEEEVGKGLNYIFVVNMDDVLKNVLDLNVPQGSIKEPIGVAKGHKAVQLAISR